MSRDRADERDNEFTMKQTRWRNPTDHRQRVVLHTSDNRPMVVTWQPGETLSVPSEYDNAIHRVDCGEEHCHKGAGRKGGGWYCTKGHNGTIVGGLAPLLERIDGDDTLDPALDPQAAEKKEAAADVAAAALTTKLTQDALIIAAARAEQVKAAQEAAATPASPTKDEAKVAREKK